MNNVTRLPILPQSPAAAERKAEIAERSRRYRAEHDNQHFYGKEFGHVCDKCREL